MKKIHSKRGNNKKEQDIISCSFFVPNPPLNGRLKKGDLKGKNKNAVNYRKLL